MPCDRVAADRWELFLIPDHMWKRMTARKENPEVCWNCGYEGMTKENSHMELDDQM